VLRPKAVDDSGFEVRREQTPEGTAYRIVGEKPTRWVRQTDFSNDEAVGYLADRLTKLGVEEALYKAGAVAGDTVLIGPAEDAVVFDWEPTLSPGAELLAGPRGTDLRLDTSSRPTRDEKRERQRSGMPPARPRRPSSTPSGAPVTGQRPATTTDRSVAARGQRQRAQLSRSRR
jgi:Obg family GTPase CgtA-like protein